MSAIAMFRQRPSESSVNSSAFIDLPLVLHLRYQRLPGQKESMKRSSHVIFVAFLLIIPGLPARGQESQQTNTYDRYCGNYRVTQDHILGIDRFVTDSGESSLLFSDYLSGVVRRLFAISETEFSMGPGFDVQVPVELKVRFMKNGQGIVTGIILQPTTGAESLAERVPLKEEQVTFHDGAVQLAGTLIMPTTRGPHPAIILLHGSGPLTRYSFGPYPHFFTSFGFAVLIYDKRGTGSSTGTLMDASTGMLMDPATYYPDDLTKDALAASRFLQNREDLNPKEIGFWGSSEGGMLSSQVAAQSHSVAFIINSSGFMTPLWQTILYQAGAIPRRAGVPEGEVQQAVAFTKLWLRVAKTGKGWEQFLKMQQTGLNNDKNWFVQSSGDFTSVEQMRWDWNHILVFSPLPALKRVTCPVLAMFGQLDSLTPASAAMKNMQRGLFEGGNKDFTLKILPNANHALMEADTGKRMAPGVFDTLRSWLLTRVGMPN
jgi:uncharacterized protein